MGFGNSGQRGWPAQGGGIPTDPTALPTWFKFTVEHTDFTAAAVSEAISLYSLPAGGIITGCKLKSTIAFTGTGMTACTMSIGIAGNLESLLPDFDVFQAVANDTFAVQENFDSYNQGAAQTIQINAISTIGLLNATLTGELCIWLLVSEAI